ncbi:MAG: phosphoribosylanthranilate isomerase [Bacteroidota bacterium]
MASREEPIKLKVCGMRHPKNIADIVSMKSDYLGLIFYPESPRYVGNTLTSDEVKQIPNEVKKVGVFVNESVDKVASIVNEWELDYAQLHGGETREQCRLLKEQDVKIIKVFWISDDFDFDVLKAYEPYVDFFLFDTKGKHPGGNGETFNWDVLKNYNSIRPMFLSGGIGLEEAERLCERDDLNIHTIDVNSRFEIEPGMKDVDKIKKLKEVINKMNAN